MVAERCPCSVGRCGSRWRRSRPGRIALEGVVLIEGEPAACVHWIADTRKIRLDERPRLERAHRDFIEQPVVDEGRVVRPLRDISDRTDASRRNVCVRPEFPRRPLARRCRVPAGDHDRIMCRCGAAPCVVGEFRRAGLECFGAARTRVTWRDRSDSGRRSRPRRWIPRRARAPVRTGR